MKLSISHVTKYEYAEAVTDSVNEIRLTPSTNERQSCYQQAISIEPNASLFTYEDYFGNRVHAFSVNGPHKRLTIRTSMTVVTKQAPSSEERAQYLSRRPPEQAWSWLRTEDAANRFTEFLLASEYTAITSEVEQFASEIPDSNENGQASVLDWLSVLSTKIRTEFIYDPEATDVKTRTSDM
jgi:transglutaminase-like putative cysteine protease